MLKESGFSVWEVALSVAVIYLYIDAKVKQAKTEKAHALSMKKMEKKVLGLETQLMNFFACPNVGCPLRRTRTLGSANTSTDEGE